MLIEKRSSVVFLNVLILLLLGFVLFRGTFLLLPLIADGNVKDIDFAIDFFVIAFTVFPVMSIISISLFTQTGLAFLLLFFVPVFVEALKY